MNYPIIGFTLGCLLTILGVAELLPMFLDLIDGHQNASSFFLCSVISIFFGGSLIIANKNFHQDVTVRQAFLLTTLLWTFMAVFSALPLYISDLGISYADAFFEAMSGITTTGSTVLTGLDQMSRGVLFWRSITQWIGGIGIIAFAIVLLPFLKIGGMQLFKSESSAAEKPLSRLKVVVSYLLVIYIGLTFICLMTYKLLGMSWFDAVNHAMTTLSTGGFSTHDASFGHFEGAGIPLAATLFMLLGGLPFMLYLKFVFQQKNEFWKNEEFRAITVFLAVTITMVALWLWAFSDNDLGRSFLLAAFNITSIITTTGFAYTDYMLWGPFATMFFFFITYLGACTGSTSGGLKMMRAIILGRVLVKHLKTLIYPHGTFVARYQNHALSDKAAMNVLGFMGLYVLFNVGLTGALTFLGLDFTTAVSGAATAIANVGPGVGHIIGPAGNFSSLNDPAKWLLSFGMLVGRLEILTVAVLFTPRYWKP